MKPKILYTTILLHIIGFVYSQNWAVFNKDYRYNYSLENENYTTVVIFADSTLIQGADTIYSLNRIAAKCDSCWFYYPEPGVADSNYIMINQPQFMQRRIVYSNNQYHMSDTSNYIIPRFASVGNSWTFNAARAITAQVISATIKNYFGVSDSVNTILLNTNDTIIISKQFGIVKYPAKFGQQMYYKLRGIESGSVYDVLALYGEKVPNYYDFFKLKPGVIHYYSTTSTWAGSNSQCYYYLFGKKTITSSSLTGTVIANSYLDDRRGCNGNCFSGMGGFCWISNPATFSLQPVTNYSVLNTPPSMYSYGISELYNLYNNKFIAQNNGMTVLYYVLKFGKTTNNHFFKTYGASCFSSHIQNNPILNSEYSSYYSPSTQNPNVYYTKTADFSDAPVGETYIDGYGQVNAFFPGFESQNYYCTSAIIDGADTLGSIEVVNIATLIKNEENNHSSLAPNPTQDVIIINFPFESIGNTGMIEVKDIFGKTVFQKSIVSGASSEKINLQNCAQGVYFVDVKIPHFQKQYKVIKE